MPLSLHGHSLIGDRKVAGTQTFRARSPLDSAELDPPFQMASELDVDAALRLADEAFQIYRETTGEVRAAFLDRIGDEIMAIGDALIARAHVETGLPEARLTGERARTVNQLRLFAQVAREGSWVDARIDTAIADRQPAPKPNLRRMLVPIGPVVVFGSSNFPLAFSVAGGDTASALATGNPVIVKAHSGHPGTSELVAGAVARAVESCGLPPGVFSMLHGAGKVIGMALVRHPSTTAVGFTGSRDGRTRALRCRRGSSGADSGLRGNEQREPGVHPPPRDARAGCESGRGTEELRHDGRRSVLHEARPRLRPGRRGVRRVPDDVQRAPRDGGTRDDAARGHFRGVSRRTRPRLGRDRRGRRRSVVACADAARTHGEAVIARTDSVNFRARPELAEEVFGPYALLISASSLSELEQIARNLDGQLTATVHGTPNDLAEAAPLLRILEQKAGRLIINGFPTGVEVCPSMHHGGPYPATTDVRFTSVGTAALYRFVRPVCYQDFPPELLPPALRDDNPLGIRRMVNGVAE